MPSLDFKGKSFIYTHHLGVPYRELLVVSEKSCPAEGGQPDLDDNLIIHGDNLEALKALLPRYAGRVDCIFIDPPYNTGNEGWCYNDKVNSPLMREWLKKEGNPVEREDLQRHDKWLCMMWPRLQLLKELLADEGSIFISIDDNEVHRLRAVMDEVFGEENFLANFVWQSKDTPGNNSVGIAETHNHIVFYRKSDACEVTMLERNEAQLSTYSNPDEDQRGDWLPTPLTRAEFRERDYYTIENKAGREVWPPKGSSWRRPPAKMKWLQEDNRIWWGKSGDAEFPMEKKFLSEVKAGVVNQTWWPYEFAGSTRNASAELKAIFGGEKSFDTPKPVQLITRILELASNENSIVLDSYAGSGTTAQAVLALNKKDGGNRRFILVQLPEELAPDHPARKEGFTEVADLTAERVRRVICGYDYTGTQETELHPPEKVTWTTFAKDKKRNEILDRIEGIKTKIEDGLLSVVGRKTVQKQMPGIGGSFTYLELGEAMDLERLLAETPGTLPSFPALARYLFFTATGHILPSTGTLPASTPAPKAKGKAKIKSIPEPAPSEAPILIGETAVWRIYLHYQPDEAWLRSPAAAFTRTHAEAIAAEGKGTGKQSLVFAAAKFISHKPLRELKVDFAQLPYSLHRVQAE
jgi:adenine-specific DNA-methyltransferase